MYLKIFLSFYIDFLIFNSRKLLARLLYVLASGWHSWPLDGGFDATRCSNLVFCYVLRSATVPFFSWCDVCWQLIGSVWWQLIGSLSLFVIFFFFLVFSLTEKIHVFFFNFILNFSSYIFYCLFSSFSLLEKFFMFLI